MRNKSKLLGLIPLCLMVLSGCSKVPSVITTDTKSISSITSSSEIVLTSEPSESAVSSSSVSESTVSSESISSETSAVSSSSSVASSTSSITSSSSAVSSESTSSSTSTSVSTSAITSESSATTVISSEVVSSSETSSTTSEEVVKAVFPTEEIVAFYSELGIDVVVPEYVLASEVGTFETDDSYPGYFDVYPIDTTSAELVAYKDALKESGWVVTSANEETSEDFILRFGETIAYVGLLNYTSYAEEGEAPYNLVSFYTYVEPEVPEYTVASAIDAVAELLSELLESEITAVHGAQGDYIVLNFGDSLDVETMKLYSDYFFVPTGFEALTQEWQSDEFSDGTPVDYIDYFCGDVALEYCIYTITEPAEYVGLYYQVEAFSIAE